MGCVLPLVGFHAQEPSIAAIPWLALLPSMLLALGGNVLTALPDEPADRLASKRTWAVRRGVPAAARDLTMLVALAILLGALLVPFPGALARVLSTALPLGVLGTALPFLPRDRTPPRAQLLRFMLACGGASALNQVHRPAVSCQ